MRSGRPGNLRRDAETVDVPASWPLPDILPVPALLAGQTPLTHYALGFFTRMLFSCLAAIKELARGYGSSLVLCSATQPAVMDEHLRDDTGRALPETIPARDLREIAPSQGRGFARNWASLLRIANKNPQHAVPGVFLSSDDQTILFPTVYGARA